MFFSRFQVSRAIGVRPPALQCITPLLPVIDVKRKFDTCLAPHGGFVPIMASYPAKRDTSAVVHRVIVQVFVVAISSLVMPFTRWSQFESLSPTLFATP